MFRKAPAFIYLFMYLFTDDFFQFIYFYFFLAPAFRAWKVFDILCKQ